jgi:hypothetical protein
MGEVEAFNTTTIRRLNLSPRHQLPAIAPTQDYVLGTAAAHRLTALFVQPGQPNRFVLRVGAGREMHVFAGERAALFGICEGVLVNIINAFIDAGSGRLITPTPP